MTRQVQSGSFQRTAADRVKPSKAGRAPRENDTQTRSQSHPPIPTGAAAADALSSSSVPVSVPRVVRGTAHAVRLLEHSTTDDLLSSRQTGDVLVRRSLSALYALAADLHSAQLPYPTKQLRTDAKAERVSTGQIWGQMNMLLRPVLRRLHDRVRQAERLHRRCVSSSSVNKAEALTRRGPKQRSGEHDDDDAEKEERQSPGQSTRAHRHRGATTPSASDESEIDAEMEALLHARRGGKRCAASATRAASGSARGTGGSAAGEKGSDDWRFAFGKGNAADEDWGQEAEDAASDADNNDDNDNDDDDDADALRMMYGEDFVGDGSAMRVMGGEDGEELAADIELDDPAVDMGAEASRRRCGDEQSDTFRPPDGQYWGRDNILDERDDGSAAGGVGHDADADADAEAEAEGQDDPSETELARERRRERRLVAQMETQRLYHTHWAMTGETSAPARPRDALLDHAELDFDYGMKAVPVITAAVTAQLEDRIRRRILAAQYDDVQRRTTASRPEDLFTTRRPDGNEAEKSKLSLMDLYEKEYEDKMRRAAEEAEGGGAGSHKNDEHTNHRSSSSSATAEPLTEVEKDELRALQMWRRLAQHLDGLSNFFYTPRPVQPEWEARVRAVESQAPAIAMETMGNFATTRQAALAPQDLYRGSARTLVGVGTAEMTPQERHRLRRSRKDAGKLTKSILQTRNKRRTGAKSGRADAAGAVGGV